jgi:hypothetical protein
MNCLCLFAKYPSLGKVKSRLAAEIGEEEALLVYRKLLDRAVFEHTKRGYDLVIGYSGEGFGKLYPDVSLYRQEGNNLGERMKNMFSALLSTYENVVLIGVDVIVEKEIVLKAFSLLDSHDIVLGPATDGGYYLIGMKEVHDVFSGISFGSATVFSETMEKCKGLSVGLVEEKQDIDKKKDLGQLTARKA